jgi:hypothetical protein
MCREEIAVCSEVYTEQIYALRGQKVRILILVVRIITTCLHSFKTVLTGRCCTVEKEKMRLFIFGKILTW